MEHQISPATFYKWKKEVAIEQDEDKRRLKQLEEENARLKKMYADLSLDHSILQQGYEMLKKYQAQAPRRNDRLHKSGQGGKCPPQLCGLGLSPTDLL